MTDRTRFQFGEETVAELTAIGGITPQIIESLRQVCDLFKSPEISIPRGKRNAELQRLSNSLNRLSKVMIELSTDSTIDLMTQISRDTPTNAMLSPVSAASNIDYSKFRVEAVALLGAVNRAMAAPGKSRHERLYQLAELTALHLKLNGLSLSTSPTDTFMAVLELLFSELYPTEKGAAHLRYGGEAIKRAGTLYTE